MNRAVAYIRVSGAGQTAGDGFERQRKAIAEYAEKSGYQIVSTYQETFTGTVDHLDRPAMREMLQDLIDSKDGVRHIIVEKLDRLARDVLVQEAIIRKVRDLRLELLSTCEDNLCSDDPSREFIRIVLGAVAMLDKKLIVIKTRAARERIRNSGKRCEGRKPYGHREGEQRTIQVVLLMTANGHSQNNIARIFNKSGRLTRSGGKWTGVQIKRILEREREAK